MVTKMDLEKKFDRELWPFYWISRSDGLYLKELEIENRYAGEEICGVSVKFELPLITI